MSLYTRKKGQYVKLTKHEIRRLRRNDEVNELQRHAVAASVTLKGLAAWLRKINEQGMLLRWNEDLLLTRLPEQRSLQGLATCIEKSVTTLRGM